MAINIFRNAVSQRKTLRVAKKRVSLQHKNMVQGLGYSLQPSAFGFEFCYLMIDKSISIIWQNS